MIEHILRVEDERAMQTPCAIRLRVEKYILDAAVDGEEVIGQFANQPFDLITPDVMSSYRNGFV